MSKRRLSNREIDDLKKIENLLDKSKVEYKNNNIKVQEKPKYYLHVGDKVIPTESIAVTDHAFQRTIERFSLKHTSKSDVESYIRKHLADAKYVGRITDENENDSEAFVKGHFYFHLSPELDRIFTVIKVDHKIPNNPAKDKIVSLLHKEFRKADRAEKAKLRKIENLQLEIDVELAQLRYRMHRTRSEAVKMACQARMNALQMSINELKDGFENLKVGKRQIARALSCSM